MSKSWEYDLTLELLIEYRDSALNNAESLLHEAALLEKNNFFARAYFLACASMEETGKAFLLFNAQARNLKDGGVQKITKQRIENHSSKISASFHALVFRTILSTRNKEQLLEVVSMALAVKNAREPSMYVDVTENNTVQTPSNVVKPINSNDIIKVAKLCLDNTKEYIKEKIHTKTSSYDDKVYCMSKSLLNKIMELNDFWEYLLASSDPDDFSKLITIYNESYYQAGKEYTKVMHRK